MLILHINFSPLDEQSLFILGSRVPRDGRDCYSQLETVPLHPSRSTLCNSVRMGWCDLCCWRHSFPRTKLLPARVRLCIPENIDGSSDGAWCRDASQTPPTKRSSTPITLRPRLRSWPLPSFFCYFGFFHFLSSLGVLCVYVSLVFAFRRYFDFQFFFEVSLALCVSFFSITLLFWSLIYLSIFVWFEG